MRVSLYEELIRPDIRGMEPYAPILPFEVLSQRLGRKPEEIIKLDANENPYGPSPLVRERLARFPYYHIYPDPQQEQLRAALARYVQVPEDNILPGHGADELIDLICRMFLRPGDAIINLPPTFGMYEFDTRINGGDVLHVWRDEQFRPHLEEIITAVTQANADGDNRVKLLFLTSPNNPDGSTFPEEMLDPLLDLPLIVVVDEAYIEFADRHSLAQRVVEHENLIVLRTFSKWAGLAGLRLGYGIFPDWLMPHLWQFKQPYNVNVAATVAGLAALEDTAYYERTVAAIIDERERLYRALERVPYLKPYPSQANFILCRVDGQDARALKEFLSRLGILVRYFNKPRLRDFIRIGVGKPEHTDRLIEALEAFEREY